MQLNPQSEIGRSVRLADDYGDGPAEDIPADWHSRTAAVPAAREWGSEEEALVQRGTGCDDGGAVTAALKECAGNSDKVCGKCFSLATRGTRRTSASNRVTPPGLRNGFVRLLRRAGRSWVNYLLVLGIFARPT